MRHAEDFNIQHSTFNFQHSMIKQEQEMAPHRHFCHPKAHARMIPRACVACGEHAPGLGIPHSRRRSQSAATEDCPGHRLATKSLRIAGAALRFC
ncbi:MAG: hypothetical protein NTW21_36160 [Verrucomicrobia bacterium]|nr:hypothetical protein [Verrucomicrobiota bacterium]